MASPMLFAAWSVICLTGTTVTLCGTSINGVSVRIAPMLRETL